ncbi:MAG: hypothetical protein H6684_04665 [Deltaproteobacteria bacterium]|nr:hypothetical protein [Deltaproteobacteria bacterium]
MIAAQRVPWSDLSRGERIRVLLLAFMIFGGHLLAHLWTKYSHLYIVAAILLAIPVVTALRDRWENTSPWTFRIAVTAYYLFVAVNLAPLLVLVVMGDPWAWVVILVYAPLTYLRPFGLPRRIAFGVNLLVGLVLFLVAQHRLMDSSLYMTLRFAPFFVLHLAGLARPRTLDFFSRTAVAFFFLVTAIFPIGYIRYFGAFPEAATEIAKQRGVELVYGYNKNSPLGGRLGNRFMFANSLGDGVLLSPHAYTKTLYLITYSIDLAEVNVESIDLKTRAGDRLIYHPGDPSHAFLPSVGRIYEIAANPLRIVEEIPVAEGQSVNNLRIDQNTRQLYGTYDGGKRIFRMHIDPPHQVTESQDVGRFVWTEDSAVDPLARRFYLLSLGVGANVLVQGITEDLWFVRQVRLPGPYSIFMEYDAETKRLFLVGHWAGELSVLNAETFEEIDRVPIGAGARDIAFDRERRLLYITNYFTGELTALDVDRFTVQGHVFLGKILRPASIDSSGNYLFARSGAGIFRVNLQQMLGNVEPVAEPSAPLRLYHHALDFITRWTMWAIADYRQFTIDPPFQAETNDS